MFLRIRTLIIKGLLGNLGLLGLFRAEAFQVRPFRLYGFGLFFGLLRVFVGCVFSLAFRAFEGFFGVGL